MDNIYLEVAKNLGSDFRVDAKPDMTEEEILMILTLRVKEFLDNDRNLLLSYLYRLDIPQNQILTVLRVTNIIPPEESLARLILNRQIERVKTKKKYKQEPIEGWEF